MWSVTRRWCIRDSTLTALRSSAAAQHTARLARTAQPTLHARADTHHRSRHTGQYARGMSSTSQTPPADAVALTTSSSKDVGAAPQAAATAAADAGAAFESNEPKKPVVYVPFKPTNEWQVIEENHILPPGLWIQFDFEGRAMARFQPAKTTTTVAAAETQKTDPTGKENVDALAGDLARTSIAVDSDANVSVDVAVVSPVAAAASLGQPASKTRLSAPAATANNGPKRGMSTMTTPSTTSTKKVYSSRGRPVINPVYTPPSAEFLAARAPLPAPGAPIISIAPMVDVTDRHYRYLLRLISKHVVLYTPMLVDNALLRAPLAFPLYVEHLPVEHPVIAQLGGSEPDTMVRAALICQEQGFQQVNINVGCPAPSASGHAYGCILMNNPQFPHTVARIVSALTIPVTIKCRIGLNKEESFEFFCDFIERCWRIGGVTRFIVHARKAVLNLRTAKNLTVPPLKYDYVHRLKEKYPELHIEINGGFDDWNVVADQMDVHGLQGVMLGRHAWKNPYSFAQVDSKFYGSTEAPPTRIEVMERYIQYVERIVEENRSLWATYEAKKAELEAIEAREDADAAAALAASGAAPVIAQNVTDSSCAASSASAQPATAHDCFRPSELLPPPVPLDLRQLLRPVGYLYANEPGYKRFRALFEEGVLHKDWTARHILTRAMTAVEPPPAREREWPRKEHTDASATATDATNKGDASQVVLMALAAADGEACCAAAANNTAAAAELAPARVEMPIPTSATPTACSASH